MFCSGIPLVIHDSRAGQDLAHLDYNKDLRYRSSKHHLHHHNRNKKVDLVPLPHKSLFGKVMHKLGRSSSPLRRRHHGPSNHQTAHLLKNKSEKTSKHS